MDLKYIKRELFLCDLTDNEPSVDIQEYYNYFKNLTHKYIKKGETETWYDNKDQWTIRIENGYQFIYTQIIIDLELKYNFTYEESMELLKCGLCIVLKREVTGLLSALFIENY